MVQQASVGKVFFVCVFHIFVSKRARQLKFMRCFWATGLLVHISSSTLDLNCQKQEANTCKQVCTNDNVQFTTSFIFYCAITHTCPQCTCAFQRHRCIQDKCDCGCVGYAQSYFCAISVEAYLTLPYFKSAKTFTACRPNFVTTDLPRYTVIFTFLCYYQCSYNVWLGVSQLITKLRCYHFIAD